MLMEEKRECLSSEDLVCCFFFWQDVKLLVEDLGELKPTIFCAVPRVLDRIYSGRLLHLIVIKIS